MEMEIVTVKKVRNGWVGMDTYGDVVAVATTEAQIADMMGVHIPRQLDDFAYITLRQKDANNLHYMMDAIRMGRKIDAIKYLRNMFHVENLPNHVNIGLREAKDMVEAIMDFKKE